MTSAVDQVISTNHIFPYKWTNQKTACTFSLSLSTFQVIRSSRDGLDIYRRLKLLEEAAEEAARDRRATAASVASAAAPVATATQCRRCNGGGVEVRQEVPIDTRRAGGEALMFCMP